MYRSLSALITTLLVACTSADAPPGATAEVPGDSTMVVPSTVEVPSDDRPVVVFLGTSLTAGLGLERDADTYVSRLEELADSLGTPFRAVNAGVSGETSAGGLRRIDWILRQPMDVLVVELGANDGLRGQDPAALRDNLIEIIRRARTRYPDVLVLVAGMEAPPNLGELYTTVFRSVFSEVAAQEDVVLIPFILEGVAGVPELNQDDRIHPTPDGHRRVAANVWPYLEEALSGLNSTTPVGQP